MRGECIGDCDGDADVAADDGDDDADGVVVVDVEEEISATG